MSEPYNQDGGAPAGPLFRRMRAGLNGIDLVSRWGVIAAMAVMATLVVVQVVFRYLFSSAIDWSEEIARLAFVWAMFLAIPHGVRSGIHVGIDVIVTRLADGAQEAFFRISAGLAALLMAVVFWYALQVTILTWPEKMPTVNMTNAVYYVAVLVAAIHSVLHLALLAWGGRNSWNGMSS
ncbi:MAG: TRAP transporter small permease [Rhodobacteraceae bacterium]|nr:TRAP transporter small permease [Paracoccaceae bacterium]MCP5341614.1 TRAP transporter small permease [Paracoccaceae bacterium]